MTASTKTTDPRYVPGVSAHDDDMTDEEWLHTMGPAPAPAAAEQTPPPNPAAEAWAIFQENTTDHQLTILHDDGMYRHLRMSAPGTRMWSWDIVTWPGHLATGGDVADGLTFSREEDMIGFFKPGRGDRAYYSDGAPSIDFRYWAEKLQGDQRQTVKEYKHKDFVDYVREHLTDQLPHDRNLTPELIEELVAEARAEDENPQAALAWMEGYDKYFSDPWEHDFRDYTFHFHLGCYAVNAAVQAYVKHTAEAGDAPQTTGS